MAASQLPGHLSGVRRFQELVQFRDWPRGWWFHLLLFLATLINTTIFGFALNQSFKANQSLRVSVVVDAYASFLHGDLNVLSGLEFSVPLMLILLVHELGHYIACQRWNVQASLPYFIPCPLSVGTLGAFIRMRSPILTRKGLFDIGASGPLAGFIVLIPFLIAGLSLSRIVPGIATHGDFTFGTPLLLRLAELVRFPGISPAHISLHPVARAAWVGLLATAINLLPIGQLDGGHIVYALFRNAHRSLSRLSVAALLPLGYFYRGWPIWALLLLVLGVWHPLVEDPTPLDGTRVKLGVVVLLVFLLSFSVIPVQRAAG